MRLLSHLQTYRNLRQTRFVLGMLLQGMLFTWNSPVTWTVDQLVTAMNLNEQVRDNLLHLYQNLFPTRVFLPHWTANVVSGSAMSFVVNTTQALNGYGAQGVGVLNDEWTFSVILASGTYSMKTNGRTTPGSGIITWKLGVTTLGTQDWYSGTATSDVEKTMSSIIVPSAGRYVLDGKMATKNASSTAYTFQGSYHDLKIATD